VRPLTFINGVILGSAGALGSVLGLIVFFRWVMTRDPSLDQTVVQGSLPIGELLRDMLIFLGLALLALAAFWGELRHKPWRGAADFVLCVTLLWVLIFFFADPARYLRDVALLGTGAAAGAVLLTVAGRLGLFARLERWLGD
jgi:ABC-type transport system involved in cytochrome c biogenesis permease subunit